MLSSQPGIYDPDDVGLLDSPLLVSVRLNLQPALSSPSGGSYSSNDFWRYGPTTDDALLTVMTIGTTAAGIMHPPLGIDTRAVAPSSATYSATKQPITTQCDSVPRHGLDTDFPLDNDLDHYEISPERISRKVNTTASKPCPHPVPWI